jgi:hypothetical protein
MLNGQVSEDQILLSHTNNWLTDKGVSKQRFAEAFLLPALRKADLVIEEPSLAESYELWFQSRKKMVTAMLNNKQNVPLSWKWAWIGCMPEPYQSDCRQDLMALNNSFYLPLPNNNGERIPMVSKLHELHKEFGELVAASRPAHDGMLDSRDEVGELREYAGQLLDLIEKAAAELVNIQVGTGVIPRRQLLAMLNDRLQND